MAKKDTLREFIEGLSLLDNFGEDLIVKALDKALVVRITKYHHKGFEFDYKRRDLAIAMLKKGAEIADLIEASPFKIYIHAAIDVKWNALIKEFNRRDKKGEKVEELALLLEFAMEIFSIGYVLKSLEEKENKEKK